MLMDNITLRFLQQADFPYVLAWSKDPEFCAANGWEIGRQEAELAAWWERCLHLNSPSFIRLGIEYKGILIGYADLAEIHNQQAEIGVAIGDRSLWGMGVGTKVVKLLIDYGVRNLNIAIFKGETHATNLRSQNMLQKLGFKEIGRIGSEMYCNEEVTLVQYQYSIY